MNLPLISTRCGRPVAALRTIQKTFALHIPADGVYSEAYYRFLEKIVLLQALHVSRTALLEIFEKEKQILRLLHVDTLSSSPNWYLDDCALPSALQAPRFPLPPTTQQPSTQQPLSFLSALGAPRALLSVAGFLDQPIFALTYSFISVILPACTPDY